MEKCNTKLKSIKELIDKYEAFIFDMDGVLVYILLINIYINYNINNIILK